jgi:protein-S-isoprenylcysteine O-methyltransferase Ste14
VLLVLGFILGLLVDRHSIVEQVPRQLRRALGLVVIVTGGALSIRASVALRAAHTPITPRAATPAIVTSGPFRWTRNPDYLGQSLMYVGVSMLAGRRGPLLVFPVLAALVQQTVVEREESYLRHRFGDTYRHYQARVPRGL